VNDAIEKILRSRQTTCLFVAHRLSTIARAERIVVLEGGRIVESGGYRELVLGGKDKGERFRSLMAAQLSAADTSVGGSGKERERDGDWGQVGVEEVVVEDKQQRS
jgi:ABC-type glutathione transport system ATPase component